MGPAPLRRKLEASGPDSQTLGARRPFLGLVLTMAVPGPVYGPAAPHDGGVDLAALGPAHRDDPAIAIAAAVIAGDDPAAGKLPYAGGAVPPAFVGAAILSLAGLMGFGGIVPRRRMRTPSIPSVSPSTTRTGACATTSAAPAPGWRRASRRWKEKRSAPHIPGDLKPPAVIRVASGAPGGRQPTTRQGVGR